MTETKHIYRNTRTTSPFSILFHVLFIQTLCWKTVTSRRPKKDKSNYLYLGANSYPVKEYIYDDQEVERGGGEDNPSFILEVTWPRVVQFYLPSSRVCQDFRQNYIEIARDIHKRSARAAVEFHAVSCSVHQELCADYEIQGVPHVLAFLSGSTEGKILQRTSDNRLNAEYVAETLDIVLTVDAPDGGQGEGVNEAMMMMAKEESDPRARREDQRYEPAVFSDASSSFLYALQTSILRTDMNKFFLVLTQQQRDAFIEWIDLLHWSLPSNWVLHNLLNDIRQNYDALFQNPAKLQHMIRSHTDNLQQPNWSQFCTRRGRRNDNGETATTAGYYCGLWKLFHILSIGVVEQHRTVLGDQGRTSTEYVAQTIRNYVQNFLTLCRDCDQEKNLLAIIDSCANRRCERLTRNSSSKANWNGLVLWLWEIHNDVNALKLQEEASRQGRVVTKEEMVSGKWPSREICPKCYRRDGAWDEKKVYAFLHHEYWPRGLQNPRFVVLGKFKNASKIHFENVDPSTAFLDLGLILAILFVCVAAVKLNWFRFCGWKRKVKSIPVEEGRVFDEQERLSSPPPLPYMLNSREGKARNRKLPSHFGSSPYYR